MADTPASSADPQPTPEGRDLAVVAAAIAATAQAVQRPATYAAPVGSGDLLDALVLLRWAQNELAGLEPRLIAAARDAAVSWQALAPALGVASRQAAERRYLALSSSAGRAAGRSGQPVMIDY